MASLMGFDKNQENVQFKGHCKLSINFMSNYLYVEPENEEFKLISSSFKWKYILKKNLLFVFAEFNFLDFCLVFRNEQVCKKIFDYFASGKKDTEVSEEPSINDSFIIPIFRRISDTPRLNSDLIETMATWHQLLNEEDKKIYSNLMKEYGIYNLIMAAVPVEPKEQINGDNNLLEVQSRKRKLNQESLKDTARSNEAPKKKLEEKYTKIIPSSQVKLMYIPTLHNRKLIVYTDESLKTFHEYRGKLNANIFVCESCLQLNTAIVDIDVNGKFFAKLESKNHPCKPLKQIPQNYKEMKIIQKPDYEILENCSGLSPKMLFIFDSKDRSYCYEYPWKTQKMIFFCRGCYNMKINYSAKPRAIIYNEGTEKEYLEIIVDKHACQKRRYDPENYQPIYKYLLKPNFKIQKMVINGKERKRLIIYDQSDPRNKFYRYSHSKNDQFYCRECHKKGVTVTAKLHKNSDNVEYIILSNAKHVCKLISNVPKPPSNLITLHPPDFEFMQETANGKPKLFLFLPNDRTKCYDFTYRAYHKKFQCNGCESFNCQQKRIKCKIVCGTLKNENSKYSFQMKLNQVHCCKPRPYQPEKYDVSLKTSNFFYFRPKNEPSKLEVAIQHPHIQDRCYIFCHLKTTKKFVCFDCGKKKKLHSILLTISDGMEYFIHDPKKHICEPSKASSITPPNFIILKEHGLNVEPKPKIRINESKIIRNPNFELGPNSDGVPDQKLIIFHSSDIKLCYEFNFQNYSQKFRCCKCIQENLTVTAKLCHDGEPYIVMGVKDHICDPVQYEIPKSMTSNFMTSKIKKSNYLLIFTSESREFCYEFREEKSGYFCVGCKKEGKKVQAKLVKNESGEEQIELINMEHACKPQKFESTIHRPKEIVPDSMFLLCKNTKGDPDKRLIIFTNDKKNFAYFYLFIGGFFYCLKCRKMGKNVSAKFQWHKNP